MPDAAPCRRQPGTAGWFAWCALERQGSDTDLWGCGGRGPIRRHGEQDGRAGRWGVDIGGDGKQEAATSGDVLPVGRADNDAVVLRPRCAMCGLDRSKLSVVRS
ncbi:hypothetical protein GCM10010300_83530 [Streptomyces olivaceoviridis]|nr:hypothetical protein GCM10010300_83530 [Streptomyces olivaceoviridis]